MRQQTRDRKSGVQLPAPRLGLPPGHVGSVIMEGVGELWHAGIPYPSVLLFGCPGSGKGSVGERIAKQSGYHFFSLGDLYRKIPSDCRLGRIYAEYAITGRSLPDDYAIGLCRHGLASQVFLGEFRPSQQLLVLDGYPRSAGQATMGSHFIRVKAVLHFHCDLDTAGRRIKTRSRGGSRPEDRSHEAIERRLREYQRLTLPVLESFDHDLVIDIDATKSLAAVVSESLQKLRRLELHAVQYNEHEY